MNALWILAFSKNREGLILRWCRCTYGGRFFRNGNHVLRWLTSVVRNSALIPLLHILEWNKIKNLLMMTASHSYDPQWDLDPMGITPTKCIFSFPATLTKYLQWVQSFIIHDRDGEEPQRGMPRRAPAAKSSFWMNLYISTWFTLAILSAKPIIIIIIMHL